MLVSKVETGLRLAMPTMVWAARWKTVSISYSPRLRSSSSRSQMSPRTTLTRSMRTGAHQLALRDPVADQADDIRAGFDKRLHQPAADQAGGAGDEDRAVLPEGRSFATLSRALCPLVHSSFKCWYSR